MCKICRIIFVFYLGLVIGLLILIKKNSQYKKENEMVKSYLDKQEKYIKKVLEKESNAKGFCHDIKNHMNMLGEYINNEDIESAKRYMLKINGAIEHTKIESYTGIIALDAVISEMCRKMDKKIEFKWEGIISNDEKIDIFDMCILFTNIISNAIEACNKYTGKKYIKVKIYQYNDVIKIYEENTHDGNIKTDKNGKLMTSKEDSNNHGYGSKNISSIIEKYDGIIKIFYDERVFKLNITI